MGLLERICSVAKPRGTENSCVLLENTIMQQQLGLAQEQRSLMAVTFDKPELADRCFTGPCLRSNHDTLLLDVSHPQQYTAYQGEPVQVRFSIEQMQTTTYLRFFSTLRGHTTLGEGIALELPTRLLSNQQREFVRITPMENAVLQLHVWPLDDDVAPAPPAAMAADDTGTDDVTLVNISVTGLRVRIKNPPKDVASSYRNGARLLCFLRLQPTDKRQGSSNVSTTMPQHAAQQKDSHSLDLWLTGTVKYYEEETKPSNLLLGVNFTAWATPGSEEKPPEWLETDPKGQIPLLYEWVLRQQLQRVSRYHCC